MSTMKRMQGNQRQTLALLLFFLTLGQVISVAKDPYANFCRRFSHQSTVIDDRLYIDGGYINYAKDNLLKNPNTWLGYHDLSNFGPAPDGVLNPVLNIGLTKNNSIPTVAGGILWPDSINKRFYLYGGEWLSAQSAEPFTLLSYDILNDQWDDFGQPKTKLNISAFGAGVGISETGMGYYYGGWLSKKSTDGGPENPIMASNFYSYNYDDKTFSAPEGPDKVPRAEGGMVWIPSGDPAGMLIYMGGVFGNGTETSPEPLDHVFIFDATNSKWYRQNATGLIPQNRRQFCVDVAWAPDKSSFNIYLWGGKAVYPPVTNVSSYSDLYILSLPSFIWVKAQPDTPGNSTGVMGRYGSSCNMFQHMSNVLIIGGDYTNKSNTACEGDNTWGAHGFWTGTGQNAGDNATWWGYPTKNIDSNVVPSDVYSVIGGNKLGGATILEPKGNYSTENWPLSMLFQRQWSPGNRKPSRNIGGSSRLSTGAIVGIAIGSAVALGVILYGWWCLGKKVLRRREQRHRSEVTQQAQQMYQDHQMKGAHEMHQGQQMDHAHLAHQSHYSYYGGSSSFGNQSTASPPLSQAQWDAVGGPGSTDRHSPAVPTELPTDHNNSLGDNKFPSPSVSPQRK